MQLDASRLENGCFGVRRDTARCSPRSQPPYADRTRMAPWNAAIVTSMDGTLRHVRSASSDSECSTPRTGPGANRRARAFSGPPRLSGVRAQRTAEGRGAWLPGPWLLRSEPSRDRRRPCRRRCLARHPRWSRSPLPSGSAWSRYPAPASSRCGWSYPAWRSWSRTAFPRSPVSWPRRWCPSAVCRWRPPWPALRMRSRC